MLLEIWIVGTAVTAGFGLFAFIIAAMGLTDSSTSPSYKEEDYNNAKMGLWLIGLSPFWFLLIGAVIAYIFYSFYKFYEMSREKHLAKARVHAD